MKGITTSYVVIALGVIVALVGYYLIGGTFGAGVTGFGLAHILLGILDMFRPSVKTAS